mmetsp:Transcript_20098/g.35746  ORF Transcript_20098/g.35746 Transcript_20098/m.35746 type:complete len:218 (+) Transcript_20098:463-1116(+)
MARPLRLDLLDLPHLLLRVHLHWWAYSNLSWSRLLLHDLGPSRHRNLLDNLLGLGVVLWNRNLPLHSLLNQMRNWSIDRLFDFLVDLFGNLDDPFNGNLADFDPWNSTDHLADLWHLHDSVLVFDLGHLDNSLDLPYLDLGNLSGDYPDLNGSWKLFHNLLELWNLDDPVHHLWLRHLDDPFDMVDSDARHFHNLLQVLWLKLLRLKLDALSPWYWH